MWPDKPKLIVKTVIEITCHEATGSTKPETFVYLYVVTEGHWQRHANGDLSSASGAFSSVSGALTSASCEKQFVLTLKKGPEKQRLVMRGSTVDQLFSF